jgi:hypothetical protein
MEIMMIDKDSKPYGEDIRNGTSGSILSSMFRSILKELNISALRFDRLLTDYINKAKLTNNVKEVSSQRGNLKKELLKTTMSWKVFIKALVFLNVRRFDMTVRLYHDNGMVTEHHKTVSLTNYTEESDNR